MKGCALFGRGKHLCLLECDNVRKVGIVPEGDPHQAHVVVGRWKGLVDDHQDCTLLDGGVDVVHLQAMANVLDLTVCIAFW